MGETINVKSQLKISLPIAFESLINILMTLVDTLVISLVGTKELAALGAMAVILNPEFYSWLLKKSLFFVENRLFFLFCL